MVRIQLGEINYIKMKEVKETNIAQVVTTEDAKILVEKGKAKFVSYGHDKQFFLVYEGNTYANREREKSYELLGRQNDR